MESNRTGIGIFISILWILTVTYFLNLSPQTLCSLKLNELGDFFAGVSAPLAFLWLVIGYFQQGEELRLSTEALRQQAKELENSVLQQQELVNVTRQQVDAERDALREERQERDRLSKPILILSGTYVWVESEYLFRIKIDNVGHEAIAFNIELTPGSRISSEYFYSVFKARDTQTLTFRRDDIPTNYLNVFFKYVDGSGRDIEKRYAIHTEEPNKLNFELINT